MFFLDGLGRGGIVMSINQIPNSTTITSNLCLPLDWITITNLLLVFQGSSLVRWSVQPKVPMPQLFCLTPTKSSQKRGGRVQSDFHLINGKCEKSREYIRCYVDRVRGGTCSPLCSCLFIYKRGILRMCLRCGI